MVGTWACASALVSMVYMQGLGFRISISKIGSRQSRGGGRRACRMVLMTLEEG